VARLGWSDDAVGARLACSQDAAIWMVLGQVTTKREPVFMTDVPFPELEHADLVVDAMYQSDATSKTVQGVPLGALTETGNQGGFRFWEEIYNLTAS
jgi:hypothetical protein